ncbi:MinD/ParA family ATP-binding protein [Pseudonocardia spinosispora]|uniref:MinD/ParA family ATP-binding protein n=1 Tax=Pseudonocardia spinosispora TaxID=103441 RepID=UPI00041694D3|nr:MinD/ParA family protein [Pseudonocardia spinosispora]
MSGPSASSRSDEDSDPSPSPLGTPAPPHRGPDENAPDPADPVRNEEPESDGTDDDTDHDTVGGVGEDVGDDKGVGTTSEVLGQPASSGELAVALSLRPFRPTPTGLADSSVVHARQLQQRTRPSTGLRGWAYRVSGGRINLGKTTAELAQAELLERIRRPLNTGLGAHHIAIASIKGGVGKTTVGACLGLTLAEARTDRVASVDVNLHAGTLHDRLIGAETPAATIQHLLDNLGEIHSINDIDRYNTLAGRLAVFAGDNDPAAGEAFAGDDYDDLIGVLDRFYNIILADCGTGLAEPAMQATLSHTDSLVVVSTPTLDAASRAAYTLEWLAHIGYGDLVDTAIVVFSHDHTSTEVDTPALRAHLAGHCAHVVDIPFDDHLSAGGYIDLGLAEARTRQAYLHLAALVTDILNRQLLRR